MRSLGFHVAPETLDADAPHDAGRARRARSCPSACGRKPSAPSGRAGREVYFETLRDCGALAVIFPEIDALFGVPQPPRWHPEIDTGVHVMLALRYAADHAAPSTVRFAVLTHDLGKAATPQGRLAESPGTRGVRRAAHRGRCVSG